jgi:hypothetical protein
MKSRRRWRLALFDATPKRRYMVVPEQREAEITIRKAD